MKIAEHGFIVTGAGSGLGAATARELVSHGANVLLVDLNEPLMATLASELGIRTHYAIADVSDPTDAQAVLAEFRETFGALHGLINCAGVAPAEKVLTREGPHRLETFARTVQVNLVGTFNMLRLCAEAMAGNTPDAGEERGVIVNTASIAAFDGQIGQVGYASSKGGVVAMTLPAARELARHGIRVVCVAPGIMETPMVKAMPAEVQDALGKMVPFPSRLGRPDEYASLVHHIITNSYLNGEVIRLDGAVRMAGK